MTKRHKANKIAKIHPDAISIRSHAEAIGTVLLDAAYLRQLQAKPYDPMEVAWGNSRTNSTQSLRRLAGKGKWLAIESHPEILDADGVPTLDIVFCASKKNRVSLAKSLVQNGWLELGERFLDLVSGELRIIYPEASLSGVREDDNVTSFPVNVADKRVQEEHYAATGYAHFCKAGFYQTQILARRELTGEREPNDADMVLLLSQARAPKHFRVASALVPFLDPAPPQTQEDAGKLECKVLDEHSCCSELTTSTPYLQFRLPDAIAKQIKLETGSVLELQFENQVLPAVVVSDFERQDKGLAEFIARQKRKSKNLAICLLQDDRLYFQQIKESRTQKLPISYHKTLPATIQIDLSQRYIRSGGTTKAKKAEKRRETGSAPDADARVVTKGRMITKGNKPGQMVETLGEAIAQTKQWTMNCHFKIDGAAATAKLKASPPETGRNNRGMKYSLPCTIQVTITRSIRGKRGSEEKQFRGWPKGIGNALVHIAKQCCGGELRNNKPFELRFNTRGLPEPSFDAIAAEKLAVAAWEEVLFSGG